MSAMQTRETRDARQVPWHALDADEALAAVEGTASGLSGEEAERRRLRFGPNELPRGKTTGIWLIYLRQFANPLVYLLLAAAAVSLALGQTTDAAFIFAVLQLNAMIGTAQEWKAETGMRGLDRMIRTWAVVTRDGRRRRIGGEDLVPGDIVSAEEGMRVCADVRLLGGTALRVDESLLTGESYPVEKNATAAPDADAPLGDRANMLYAGTSIIGGEGRGVVVGTGASTEIGRIAASLAAGHGEAPLILRLRRFINRLTVAFAVIVCVMVTIELLRGAALADIFLVAIALVVSAVPEGLPVAITVALAIGTGRMAREKVIVRHLAAVEGLGACTLIASDKTGTLTCNELTAKRIFLPRHGSFEVTGAGYAPDGEILKDGREPDAAEAEALLPLAIAGALCNEGGHHLRDGETSHYGDAVDVAFLVLARKLGLDLDGVRASHPRLGIVPFAAERRYAATFDRVGDTVVAHVKGAVEAVLPMCAGVDRSAVLAEERRLAGAGYRVLALAARTLPAPVEDSLLDASALHGLGFLGLVAFADPLRPEAAEAVARCADAGIRVTMVTGDHPVTALAIARELGLVGAEEHPGDGAVVTGAELAAADPDAVARMCDGARVFARVEPAQKLLIVEALKRDGHFVAVTGDGVNDAPALKAANIGVAMGLSGTDVARDAADLVITDDRFASIVSGVREGRIVYDNIRKVVNLLIATGAAEIVLFLLAMTAGLPLPLFAVQLLWLNLVTNGIQHVALAAEKGEPDVLSRPPRPPEQRLMDGPLLTQVALAGIYMGLAAFAFYAWMLAAGWPEDQARNTLLLLMVLFENVYVFSCRSESRSAFALPLAANPLALWSVLAAFGIHMASMHVPLMQHVLRIEPIAPGQWPVVLAIAASLLGVMEVQKAIRRRRAG